MAPSKRAEPDLQPGPAQDLVDLFKRLRDASQLRIGQIASRSGYAPSHVSEVLNGWKAPSPDAAARIARVLGADEAIAMRARRHAEDLQEWKREVARRGRKPGATGGREEPGELTYPFRYQLASPDVAINLIAGDIFDQQTHLVIGFSDTFDTSVAQDRIIHGSSIQGQLLSRLYGGDEELLDENLAGALAGLPTARVESQQDKPHGKLARYPLGTVAVLGEPSRLIFAVAYGRMGNDLVVRAPVEDLWHCLARLWEAVYRRGQRGDLSLPLIGSGLARVDTLDRQNLLQLTLLSFVAYSRSRLICHELRIVILPEHAPKIDLAGLREFLRTL